MEKSVDTSCIITGSKLTDTPHGGSPVLSEDDHTFFEENGYIILHNAVSQDKLDGVINAIFSSLSMDPEDPTDWYRKPLTRIGFVEIYQQQELWDTRQDERIYKAFSELFGTHKLWVSMDRVCFKPPYNPTHKEYKNKGFLHWDFDPWSPPEELPFGLQGVLCLTDTAENQGGFHCVPGMHKYLNEWKENVYIKPKQQKRFHEGGIPVRVPPKEKRKLPIKSITSKAGDLIIWRRELAHGNGFNESKLPRLAQYICMFPERPDNHTTLDPQASLNPDPLHERIELWKKCLRPSKFGPQDTSEYEEPATLTWLGKKLLGLEPWEDPPFEITTIINDDDNDDDDDDDDEQVV